MAVSASRFHLAIYNVIVANLKSVHCLIQETPHLLGMRLIHGKNSTKCVPGRAARLRRATKSLMALTPESSSETIGGASYVTDMIIDAVVRQRCLSQGVQR